VFYLSSLDPNKTPPASSIHVLEGACCETLLPKVFISLQDELILNPKPLGSKALGMSIVEDSVPKLELKIAYEGRD
jgi:hypothetical protein